MLSFTQVLIVTLAMFSLIGAFGVYAALSAKKAGLRERQEREQSAAQLTESVR